MYYRFGFLGWLFNLLVFSIFFFKLYNDNEFGYFEF